MALTYPAAILFENAADTATITASSSLALAPPSRLQDQHVGRKWRAETDTIALTVALAAAATLDTFGLVGIKAVSSAGVDVTSSITSRVRASLTDTSAQDGAAYDSGSAAGRVSAYYGNLVCLRDGSASVRYERFDITAPGAAYIEAGFLMTGLRHQASVNFAYGASDTPVDPSVRTRTRSQATFIDARTRWRKWDFVFDFLSETERYGWVEDLDRLCGTSLNVMVIRDCSSSNLGRDTLCGLISEGAPIIAREGFSDNGGLFSKSYSVEQRN